ncbi:MAG: hypothetical protein GPOALKHO_001056 [Sodalis sp.]|nr:MAG: hypothetical protein GPOALKHO_001056 [Sodalis sp.]
MYKYILLFIAATLVSVNAVAAKKNTNKMPFRTGYRIATTACSTALSLRNSSGSSFGIS